MLEPSLYKSIRFITSSLELKPLNIANNEVIWSDLQPLTSVDSIISQLSSIRFIDNSVCFGQTFFFILLKLSFAFAAVVNA
jgi:hypothetical protein